METTTHTVQIKDNLGNVTFWNVTGDDEDTRHLGVVMEDAVAAGDLVAAFYLPKAQAGHMSFHCSQFELMLIGYRNHSTEKGECYTCGAECPAPEGDEKPLCGDCAEVELHVARRDALMARRVA